MRASVSSRTIFTALLCSGLIFTACGSDSSDPTGTPPGVDGAAPAADGGLPGTGGGTGNPDAPVEDSCVGLADGTMCGTDVICVAAVCTPSRCGDGIVDARLGEQCEDKNEISGDGCSLCRFDCVADSGCDDTVQCNGKETCDVATHMCKTGTALADNAACMSAAVASGVCKAGTCVSAGCGNGTVDVGEECDDKNNVDTDGCTAQCKFTCKADADCDDNNACNDVETCTVATHTCKAGKSVSCKAAQCDGTCNP